jgi:hypothetical protein
MASKRSLHSSVYGTGPPLALAGDEGTSVPLSAYECIWPNKRFPRRIGWPGKVDLVKQSQHSSEVSSFTRK